MQVMFCVLVCSVSYICGTDVAAWRAGGGTVVASSTTAATTATHLPSIPVE